MPMTTEDDSASAVLSAIADRTEEIMQQERQDTQTGLLRLPTCVEGRVFRRLHHFAQLPRELKAHADALAMHLGAPAVVDAVFTTRSHWPMGHRAQRAVGPIIRGYALIAEILKFLEHSQAANAAVSTAEQLAETLVLSGFLSPVHERNDEPRTLDRRPWHYIESRGWYELVASAVLEAIRERHISPEQDTRLDGGTSAMLSVWDVVDGATRAGMVFRKQPPSTLHTLLSSVSSCHATWGREKPHYLVVNRTHHGAVFVFPDDVARQAIARIALRDAMVQYELGPMYHGLRLWTDDHTERFDFMARRDQHEWLLSLLDGGAKYKEAHCLIDHIVATPFYGQRDVTASGTEVSMGELVRGKVVVLVNVASKDPEAALQMPELVALHNQYHADGLVILACPSDQFLGLELATEPEIVAHLRHAYNVPFRVLAKRDVNGPHAREPFLYCNAHLPGAFGPFTEWNFTKFLLDRTGKPYRRFETCVMPRGMEGDIRRLLGRHRLQSTASKAKAETVVQHLAPDHVAQQIEKSVSCRRPSCPDASP